MAKMSLKRLLQPMVLSSVGLVILGASLLKSVPLLAKQIAGGLIVVGSLWALVKKLK